MSRWNNGKTKSLLWLLLELYCIILFCIDRACRSGSFKPGRELCAAEALLENVLRALAALWYETLVCRAASMRLKKIWRWLLCHSSLYRCLLLDYPCLDHLTLLWSDHEINTEALYQHLDQEIRQQIYCTVVADN